MELKDVRPTVGTFKLDATGPHEHVVRKFSLDDHIWVQDTFGKGLDEIVLQSPNDMVKSLVRIVYHQLVDKSPFKVKEVEAIDENGESQTLKLGGVGLFASMIIGPKEQYEMINAFSKTVGASGTVPTEEKKSLKTKK